MTKKSIILIIDFKLYGYGFADLNYQMRNIETIKKYNNQSESFKLC